MEEIFSDSSDMESDMEDDLEDESNDSEMIRQELYDLNLPEDFGGILAEMNQDDQRSADSKETIFNTDDSFDVVYRKIVTHKNRRNSFVCDCLTKQLSMNGGHYSLETLVEMIVESRNFIRADSDGDIPERQTRLVQRKDILYFSHDFQKGRKYQQLTNCCIILLKGCKYDNNSHLPYQSRSYQICLGCKDKSGKLVARDPINVCEVAFRTVYCISRRRLDSIQNRLRTVMSL